MMTSRLCSLILACLRACDRLEWFASYWDLSAKSPPDSWRPEDDPRCSSHVYSVYQLYTKLEPSSHKPRVPRCYRSPRSTNNRQTKGFLASKRWVDRVKMHSSSASPHRVETQDIPTSPENNNSIANPDMVARSAKSKDETAKPASLGSYAVGFYLLIDLTLSPIAHTSYRESYHMVPLMGVYIS